MGLMESWRHKKVCAQVEPTREREGGDLESRDLFADTKELVKAVLN